LTASAIRRPTSVSLLQSGWKPARTQCAAAFSTSTFRPAKAGEGDDELIAKLDSEIQMEQEMKEESDIPTSVKDYLENGPFEIIDTPGQEEIVLVRQFGDEK
jgi:complement component 1 Q subcomponent-binding protein